MNDNVFQPFCDYWDRRVDDSDPASAKKFTFNHDTNPNAGLDGNRYCRNPDQRASGIWCYLKDDLFLGEGNCVPITTSYTEYKTGTTFDYNSIRGFKAKCMDPFKLKPSSTSFISATDGSQNPLTTGYLGLVPAD